MEDDTVPVKEGGSVESSLPAPGEPTPPADTRRDGPIANQPEQRQRSERFSPDISWKAPEYIYREKDSVWYWNVGIIGVGIAIAAYILDNVLFSILSLIGAFTIALFGARHPDIVPFSIGRQGVRTGKKLYPYQSLESFNVIDTPEGAKLLLRSKSYTSFLTVIPLGDEDPDEVHAILLDYLPEEPLEEPLAQHIMNRLGF